MDENTRFWIPLVVTLLGGGVAAFFLKSNIRQLNRDRKCLGYDVHSPCNIDGEDPEFEIRYRGNPVKRAVLHTICFKNVGNQALTNLPIILHPPGGIAGYKAAAGSNSMANAEYFNDSGGRLGVRFDLLNPGDVALVAFTVFDCRNGRRAPGGRNSEDETGPA